MEGVKGGRGREGGNELGLEQKRDLSRETNADMELDPLFAVYSTDRQNSAIIIF